MEPIYLSALNAGIAAIILGLLLGFEPIAWMLPVTTNYLLSYIGQEP
jgi:hypothetical protein